MGVRHKRAVTSFDHKGPKQYVIVCVCPCLCEWDWWAPLLGDGNERLREGVEGGRKREEVNEGGGRRGLASWLLRTSWQ